MSNIQRANVENTIAMYRKRLMYLQQQIALEVSKGLSDIESGDYSEYEAFARLTEFKDEIDYISECIDILAHLKKED